MIRKTRQGSVVSCAYLYTSMVTGKLKNIGQCPEKFVTACTDIKIVQEQLRLAGWERVRSPGGVEIFCPEHTPAMIAKRAREKRERATERIWK